MPYTQDNRLIAIETPLGKDALLLTGFHGTEGLSTPFSFELDLLSENHSIPFTDIIGKNVAVSVLLAHGKRYFHGLISRFSQGRGGGKEGSDPRFSYYSATMVPWLWLLTKTADSRIFQNLSVPDIVEKIFQEKGFLDFKNKLQGSYDTWDYCVQYRETDFNFICRLFEEEGIYYFFEHENNKHTLILADTPEEHKPCPKQETARYQISAGGWLEEDTISSLEIMQEITAGKYTLKDFNFETPNTDLKIEAPSQKALGPGEKEIYDYPGGYGKRNRGDTLANVRMQEVESGITTITGSSECRAFTSGYKFDLKDYYRKDMNNKAYVLTSLSHSARQGYATEDAISEFSYINNFTCIPFETPYRPMRRTPKPIVEGVQTAIVVGPAGEEIYTDEHGRVKVQFHWDREGKKDDKSSCWIRVSQLWAGAGWGAMYIPRIGQEVIIDFLEGDPDCPIITGRVYHGVNKPPYFLPNEKSKTTIKSNSSPGGEGANEIRFEDKKGEEQMLIHAQKNMDIRIKNDQFETTERNAHFIIKKDRFDHIENNRHEIVDNDHFEKIGNDRNLKIVGKNVIEIEASHSLAVNGNVIHVFKADHSEQVSNNYYLKAMGVVIESITGITLKCGGNNIVIDPSGVTIKGTLVTIDGGMVKIASGPGSSPAEASAPSSIVPVAATAALPADTITFGAAQQAKTGAGAGDKAGTGGAAVGADEKPYKKDEKKTSWIEIELVDEEGNPVPGEKYKITLPDKSVKNGTLDEKGFARVDGIDPGMCQITFPDLDKEAWKKV